MKPDCRGILYSLGVQNNVSKPHYRICRARHPALSLVSALVTGLVPFRVGFLHKFFWSKSPMYACERFPVGVRLQRGI